MRKGVPICSSLVHPYVNTIVTGRSKTIKFRARFAISLTNLPARTFLVILSSSPSTEDEAGGVVGGVEGGVLWE